MTVTRGRILRAGTFAVSSASPTAVGEPTSNEKQARGEQRRLAKSELAACLRAEEILAEAKAKALAILAEARIEAEERARQAAEEAATSERQRLATAFVAMKKLEDDRLVREKARLESVAVVMAERLVGVALTENPSRIVSIVERALQEARGARRIVLEVEEGSQEALRNGLSKLSRAGLLLEVAVNAELAPGDVILRTDIGAMDGRIRVQLHRFISALGDVFT